MRIAEDDCNGKAYETVLDRAQDAKHRTVKVDQHLLGHAPPSLTNSVFNKLVVRWSIRDKEGCPWKEQHALIATQGHNLEIPKF